MPTQSTPAGTALAASVPVQKRRTRDDLSAGRASRAVCLGLIFLSNQPDN
jgi:hypothetical protein